MWSARALNAILLFLVLLGAPLAANPESIVVLPTLVWDAGE